MIALFNQVSVVGSSPLDLQTGFHGPLLVQSSSSCTSCFRGSSAFTASEQNRSRAKLRVSFQPTVWNEVGLLLKARLCHSRGDTDTWRPSTYINSQDHQGAALSIRYLRRAKVSRMKTCFPSSCFSGHVVTLRHSLTILPR